MGFNLKAKVGDSADGLIATIMESEQSLNVEVGDSADGLIATILECDGNSEIDFLDL